MKKLNATQLKIAMTLLMVLDHIPMFIPSELSLIFHAITRIVAVFFAYMIVEGMHYTKNKGGYVARLAIAAVIVAVGNMAINTLLAGTGAIPVENNIFLTLACGAAMVWLFQQLKSKVLIIVLSFLFGILGLFFLEGGMIVLPFIGITYAFYEDVRKRNLGYILFSISLFPYAILFEPWSIDTVWMILMNCDFLFVFIIPVLGVYDGTRGNATPLSKWFFYIFYPVHLWIISLLSLLVV